jgi:glycogen debranching enzyme
MTTANTLVVLDGSSFFVSEPGGDVVPGHDANGYFFGDMRHLSTWRLFVDGEPVRLLSSRALEYYSAAIYGTLARARVGKNPTVSVRRDRFISDGVHEDIVVENNSEQPVALNVQLHFAADFADLFEVKEPRPKVGRTSTEIDSDRVTLQYERDGYRRATVIVFSERARLEEDRATFQVELEPRQRWRCCVEVLSVADGRMHRPGAGCRSAAKPRPKMPLTLEQWLEDAPGLETDLDVLNHTYRQSLVDLAALRFRPSDAVTWSLPAAGLPWFMALFGRDSLITSYQALPFQPRLARTSLEALAALQARQWDDFRDAEPGKILHELRCGELTRFGEAPHTPYYGTCDATCLFLVLLDEYERWTGDIELVRSLEPAARRALEWIERHGDRDGDGYLEYLRRSPKGLVNQGWKDSWNSALFADGRLAEPPIALCEVQGYAFDARRRTARLARLAWNDPGLADRLAAAAAELQRRFNADFWCEQRGHYVLALDREKRQVDALTSNTGHLLWSGIVDPARAGAVVERLMAPDMFSGWGVRTMSALDRGYNPIEYHNGTVWPHDTGLIAEGFRRYGFRQQASALALAIIESAGFFEYRLPEVFAGFSREDTRFPVEYPTASRPQAWSAGAPLLAIRTLLGLEAVNDELRASPALPAAIGKLRLRGVQFRGARRDAP